MKKIYLIISLALVSSIYAQDASQNLNLERMGKPNFFPNTKELNQNKKNHTNKIMNNISIHNFSISENEQIELGIKNSEIEKFTDYYLKKTQSYFKNKKQTGSIIFLTDVSATQPDDKNIECSKKPTLCSVTSLGFIFSDDLSNEIKKDFQKYLDTEAKKDGMEIFVSNFSSNAHFKLGFQISLKDDENNDKLSKIIISKFLDNSLFKKSNSNTVEI